MMTYDHWKTTEPDGGASPPPEDDGFSEAINAVSAELDRLRESHDALLAAARHAITLLSSRTQFAFGGHPVIDFLKAAVARAEEISR